MRKKRRRVGCRAELREFVESGAQCNVSKSGHFGFVPEICTSFPGGEISISGGEIGGEIEPDSGELAGSRANGYFSECFYFQQDMNDGDFWRTIPERIRDVGVAGSNPVTPTTDFVIVFSSPSAYGSRSPTLTVPKTVPVSRPENNTKFRLSLDASRRIEAKDPLQESPARMDIDSIDVDAKNPLGCRPGYQFAGAGERRRCAGGSLLDFHFFS